MKKLTKEIFMIYQNEILKYLIYFICLLVINPTYSQKVPDRVIGIVELFLKNDSIRGYSNKELLFKKTYFVKKICSAKYKNDRINVYLFGDPSPHFYYFYILFIDKNYSTFYIVGGEKEPIQNVISLYKYISDLKMSKKNKLLLYKLIIENYLIREEGKIINRE